MENVFFHKESATIIDGIVDGLGKYSGKNAEELSVEYKGEVVTMDTERAVHLHCEQYRTPPVEVTEERFWDMLEVLPPCRWVHNHNHETFYVSERITMNIVSHFIRIGKRYFELQDDATVKPDTLLDRCRALIGANHAL